MSTSTSNDDELLVVDKLSVEFPVGGQWRRVVDDFSLRVKAGELCGIVGESGSGKSVTALAIAGLLPLRGGRIGAGSVKFQSQELTHLSEASLSAIRGSKLGMIFQQPTRCLNPAYTVGDQIAEAIRLHERVSYKVAWRRAIELLDRVGIPDAQHRVDDYPHLFSGGMCQRVMIAIALACKPVLLIADEPTTALDVTIQAKILELLRSLQLEHQMAIVMITHDLGVVAEFCEKLVVMHAGQTVESGVTNQILQQPRHPYTSGLLSSVKMDRVNGEFATIPGSASRTSSNSKLCRFQPRCGFQIGGRCDVLELEMARLSDTRAVRCLRVHELALRGVAG